MNIFKPSQVVCYNFVVVNTKLYIASFILGAVVMVFEMVGSRIVAPYMGTATIIWTSIVGTLLAFLSYGYFLGGRVAHKFDIKKLSLLILVAGYWLIVVALFRERFLYLVAISNLGEAPKAIVASIFLFSIFSIAAGAVTPIIAEIGIKKLKESGKVTGYLWALSTLGSIFGTFLAGFYLIPTFGSLRLIYLMSGTLSFMALFLSLRPLVFLKIALIAISIMGFIFGWQFKGNVKGLVADIETTMYRVWIIKKGETKKMYIDQALSSSSKKGTTELPPNSYYKYYDLMFWNKPVRDVVMIGGAGMTYPRYSVKYPNLSFEVVEIDPEMESIAEKYLDYEKSDRIKVVNLDGRIFFHKTKKTYDAILIDAFLGKTIPFHLVTKEALSEMKAHLSDRGVVVINVAGAMTGKDSQLFRSILTTFKNVFGEVKVFAVEDIKKGQRLHNLIILASNGKLSDDPGLGAKDKLLFLGREVKKNLSEGLLLTDDFAPVDYWSYKQETY